MYIIMCVYSELVKRKPDTQQTVYQAVIASDHDNSDSTILFASEYTISKLLHMVITIYSFFSFRS